MAKVEKTKNKARYWVGVCYPENMQPDWQDKIGDLLQLPYCYCIHDKDLLDPKSEEEENRKVHVHIIIVYGNTTTYNSALQTFNSLSKEGAVCCPFCESIINIKNKYEYLIHNTETAKKQHKFQYDPAERICGNNFDLGSYIQITAQDKKMLIKEMTKICKDMKFINFLDFTDYIFENYDTDYFDVFMQYNGFFEKITRSNYQKKYNQLTGKNYDDE